MRITLSDAATLFHADCRDAIRALPSDSIDSVCTDPPYAINFMGKKWDTGDVAFHVDFWAEVYRVLKPGAFVAAFGATRQYHRMACAIEDAGFEIRDSLMYLYGTGFPKSHNLDNKRGDLICGCETESSSECDMRHLPDADVSQTKLASEECGQILQSSMSQQSTSIDRTETQTGRIQTPFRTDQPRLEGWSLSPGTQGQLRVDEIRSLPAGSAADGSHGRVCDGTSLGHVPPLPIPSDPNGVRAPFGPRPQEQRADELGIVAGQPIAQDGGTWPNCRGCGKPVVTRGLGSALKPAFEPIVLARKPCSEKTVAVNVLKWRTGALNIDVSRIHTEGSETKSYTSKRTAPGATQNATGERHGTEIFEGLTKAGRWPANVVTDDSDEVVAMFPSAGGQQSRARAGGDKASSIYGRFATNATTNPEPRGDSGSAARFFYSAKASKADRAGSKHPTVKPIALMEWLATLITPPGGTILDPFAGSGTTGAAAVRKGFNVILCEREAEYVADIRARFGVARPSWSEAVRRELEILPALAALRTRLAARA